MSFTSSHILLFLGLIFILAELIIGAATGFDLFLVGLTLILGFPVALKFGFNAGLVTTIILSILYFVLGRRFVKKNLSLLSHRSNIDQLINKEALVTKEITPHGPGAVKINNELWRAASTKTIPQGKTAIVKSVEGITLNVVPKIKN